MLRCEAGLIVPRVAENSDIVIDRVAEVGLEVKQKLVITNVCEIGNNFITTQLDKLLVINTRCYIKAAGLVLYAVEEVVKSLLHFVNWLAICQLVQEDKHCVNHIVKHLFQ